MAIRENLNQRLHAKYESQRKFTFNQESVKKWKAKFDKQTLPLDKDEQNQFVIEWIDKGIAAVGRAVETTDRVTASTSDRTKKDMTPIPKEIGDELGMYTTYLGAGNIHIRFMESVILKELDKHFRESMTKFVPFSMDDVYFAAFKYHLAIIRYVNLKCGRKENNNVKFFYNRFAKVVRGAFRNRNPFIMEMVKLKLSIANELNTELMDIAKLSAVEMKRRLQDEDAREKIDNKDLMNNIKTVSSVVNSERSLEMREKMLDAIQETAKLSINPIFFELGAVKKEDIRDAEIVEPEQIEEPIQNDERITVGEDKE